MTHNEYEIWSGFCTHVIILPLFYTIMLVSSSKSYFLTAVVRNTVMFIYFIHPLSISAVQQITCKADTIFFFNMIYTLLQSIRLMRYILVYKFKLFVFLALILSMIWVDPFPICLGMRNEGFWRISGIAEPFFWFTLHVTFAVIIIRHMIRWRGGGMEAGLRGFWAKFRTNDKRWQYGAEQCRITYVIHSHCTWKENRRWVYYPKNDNICV